KDLSHIRGEIDRNTTRRDTLSLEIAAWMAEEQELERELHDLKENENRWQIEKREREDALARTKALSLESDVTLDLAKADFTKAKLEAETMHEKKASVEKELTRLL